MNEYKESLQVDAAHLLENQEIKEAKSNMFDEEVKRYREFYDNPDYQDYLKNLMAAIMLVQNRRYPNYLINISSRFKAPKSIKSKVNKRLKEANMGYDENGDNLEINSRPLLDAFAMKIISKRTPLIYYSTDSYINDLINKRDKNQNFLREMQKFKSNLIYDDFTDRKNFRLRDTVTKIEYYENCKKILESLLSSISSSEVGLIASYEAKLKDIENRLNLLKATPLKNSPEAIFNEDDLKNNDINFFDLLTDYEERYNNNVEIYMATMQFLSLFENSKIFEKLGVSVDYSLLEEKRAESGYESNFVILNTPIGPVECQIQTESQRKFGNVGPAAHSKMKGKAVQALPIPEEHDKPKIREFIRKINEIAPKYYLASMDENEQERVIIQQLDDYQNYKALISQVSKDDPIEKLLYLYFSKLSALSMTESFQEEKLTKGETLGFTTIDISQYANSDKVKKLKEIAQNKENENKLSDNEMEL